MCDSETDLHSRGVYERHRGAPPTNGVSGLNVRSACYLALKKGPSMKLYIDTASVKEIQEAMGRELR